MTDRWFDDWAMGGKGFVNGVNRRPPYYDVVEAVKFFNKKLDLKKTDYVVDVGCGNGLTAHELYKYSQKIMAVDAVPDNIRLVEVFLKDDVGISSQVSFAESLPFPDNTFDKVICLAVLQYYEELENAKKAMSELCRVCKPNGKIYVGDLLDKRLLPSDFIQPGMKTFLPEELGEGYKYISFPSYFEPERRFDMLITK